MPLWLLLCTHSIALSFRGQDYEEFIMWNGTWARTLLAGHEASIGPQASTLCLYGCPLCTESTFWDGTWARTLLASHEAGALENAVHGQAGALEQGRCWRQPVHSAHQIQQHGLHGTTHASPPGRITEASHALSRCAHGGLLRSVFSVLGMRYSAEYMLHSQMPAASYDTSTPVVGSLVSRRTPSRPLWCVQGPYVLHLVDVAHMR